MSNVFINGKEVSGKATSNKTIAAMPDVCLSPPSPPAGPIPIPYPNFGQASDTTGGSRTVRVGGKEVGLKGKSKWKKSKGDEAATRNFGASVLSHAISGPVEHQAGSFDVTIEGCAAVRFMDLTTGNHGSPGMPLTMDQAQAAIAEMGSNPCGALKSSNSENRSKSPDNPTGLTEKQNVKTTLTSFEVSTPPGQPGATSGWTTSKGFSKVMKNGGAPGMRREGGNVVDNAGNTGKDASNLCEAGRAKKGPYQSTTANATCSHTEARIIESVFRNDDEFCMFPGGQPPQGTIVTMAIDWPQPGGTPSDDPCDQCHKVLCAAQACGVVIALCDEDDEPQTIEEKTGEPCS